MTDSPDPRDVCPCGEVSDDFGACWRCDAPLDRDGLVRGGRGRSGEENRADGMGCIAALAWLAVVVALCVVIAWMEGRAP